MRVRRSAQTRMHSCSNVVGLGTSREQDGYIGIRVKEVLFQNRSYKSHRHVVKSDLIGRQNTPVIFFI